MFHRRARTESPPRSTGFFTGPAALAEVAKPDGTLNWAMVGSDVERLPLAGSGSGGVNGLKKALGEHPVSFALLRLAFKAGDTTYNQLVFISSVAGSRHKSKRQVNIGTKHQMKEEFEQFGAIDFDLNIQHFEQLTEERICTDLANHNSDEVTFTVENYRKGQAEFLKSVSDPGLFGVSSGVSSRPAYADFVEDSVPVFHRQTSKDDEPKGRVWKVGETVAVYCKSEQTWVDDGIVLLVLTESNSYDGYKLPVGAIKVQYSNQRRFKWVLQDHVDTFLRPSTRPSMPTPMMGELFKETHNIITEWHVRHVEINRGFMQWWQNPDDARSGLRPNAVAGLTGMKLQVEEGNNIFRFSTASTNGMVYSFDATSVEGRNRWVGALERHHQYCHDLLEHMQRKRGEFETGSSTFIW